MIVLVKTEVVVRALNMSQHFKNTKIFVTKKNMIPLEVVNS